MLSNLYLLANNRIENDIFSILIISKLQTCYWCLIGFTWFTLFMINIYIYN
jgi:hypothetical protein